MPGEREMNPFASEGKGELYPGAPQEGSHFVVFYLGDESNDVIVREETVLDFQELMSRLHSGGSVFMTMKKPDRRLNNDEVCEWC